MATRPPVRDISVHSHFGAAVALVRTSLLHPRTETRIHLVGVRPLDTSNYRRVVVHSAAAVPWALVREAFRHPMTGTVIEVQPRPRTRPGVGED